MTMREPVLLQRHRVIATVVVLALFALAITAAVFRVSALDEAETSARQQAATREVAQLKVDYEAHKASIAASIRADVAGGRIDDADALLKKYRRVAGGALDVLAAKAARASR